MSKKVKKLDMTAAQAIVSDMQRVKMLCVQANWPNADMTYLKGRYHSIGVDLNLFPRYIAYRWLKTLTATNLEQFRTRALYFAKLAGLMRSGSPPTWRND